MTASHAAIQPSNDRRLGPGTSDATGGILVVDDDPVVLNLLEAYLPRLGFAVWTADGGQAGLHTYEHHRDRIDLVLLDVRMPAPDGPATLRELRRRDPHVACCFMTGHSGLYDPDALLEMGAAALFEKPFDLPELERSLRRLVTEVRAARAGRAGFPMYNI
jgi:DNA-binding response OmpR family regulator